MIPEMKTKKITQGEDGFNSLPASVFTLGDFKCAFVFFTLHAIS